MKSSTKHENTQEIWIRNQGYLEIMKDIYDISQVVHKYNLFATFF